MASNHGKLCRDLIGGSLRVKDLIVLDRDANLCVSDGKVKGDLRVKGNVTADGFVCAEALATSVEFVVADNGAATIDAHIGISVVTGATNEGGTIVTLPDPTNAKARVKQVVASSVDGGTMQIIPTNYGGPGTGISFDNDGEGAIFVWVAGKWWCTGTCGGVANVA